jgi:hypothetical protein
MSDVRWEGFSHDEIYVRVQQGPGRLASADAEAAWSTVESTIRTVDEHLTQAVNRIGAGWQGRAADAVHGGMTVMSNWALDAAGDATLTRNGITAQADQAARLRAAMPPPHTAEWNRMVHEQIPAVGLMSATGDLGALEERMANDHAVAVDMMNRYSSQSSDNQRMMNYWTPPPTVVVEAAGPAAAGGVGALAAATTVRPGAVRAGPPLGTAGGRSGGGVPAVSDAATGTEGNGAAVGPGAAPAAAGTRGRSGSAVSGAVPTSGAGRPGTTGRAGAPAPGRSGSGDGRAGTPPSGSAGRSGPGVIGRPSAPETHTPRGPLPGSASGGVRPVVPGPPTQAGSAGDWRTGLRTAPVEPPGGPPRPTVPGTEPPPRPAVIPAEGERAPTGRTGSGHGFFPMAGAARPVDQEHRRPAYLVDDTDAFADDRWFPPSVIGADLQASRA